MINTFAHLIKFETQTVHKNQSEVYSSESITGHKYLDVLGLSRLSRATALSFDKDILGREGEKRKQNNRIKTILYIEVFVE